VCRQLLPFHRSALHLPCEGRCLRSYLLSFFARQSISALVIVRSSHSGRLSSARLQFASTHEHRAFPRGIGMVGSAASSSPRPRRRPARMAASVAHGDGGLRQLVRGTRHTTLAVGDDEWPWGPMGRKEGPTWQPGSLGNMGQVVSSEVARTAPDPSFPARSDESGDASTTSLIKWKH
jgi:hypothetical protein